MKRRAQSERYSFQSLAFCDALSGSPISFAALSIRTTASGKAHQPFNKKESREPRAPRVLVSVRLVFIDSSR
jgi:hypothetical protein